MNNSFNSQSLSVCVPGKSCINSCLSCVACQHCADYKNQMDDNLPFFDLYATDYLKRLEFARDNGCNTVMLTGNVEPQQNRQFLTYFGFFMKFMKNPFHWIEMQTTGAGIDRNYLRFMRNHVGVNLMSISTFSFNDEENMACTRTPQKLRVNLQELTSDILEYDFTLRLSVNLTNSFDKYESCPEKFFDDAKTFGAEQLTLRVLYAKGDTPQANWVRENAAKKSTVKALNQYVIKNGTLLGRLPYGAYKFSLNDMCVVVDEDSMSKNEEKKENAEVLKYLILREDCHIYTEWDTKSSKIF